MTTTYTFQPDYAVPPGETLRELLDAKGLSHAHLAMRTGLAKKTISQIMTGDGPISLDTADKLELALGVPSRFWNSRELAYRESLARSIATERFASDVAWLKEIPCKELINRGFVEACADKAEMVRRALGFFCVSSVEAWRETFLKPAARFRGGDVAIKHPGKVAAWLRIGEIEAEKITCKPFDPQAFKNALVEIRKLLDQPSSVWRPAMTKHCAEAGVAVVFVKEIQGASVSGATHWASKDKAILQLSLKFKKDDQLLFSFFHEAAHILKHGKKLVFVDTGDASKDELEKEADQFAGDILIPPIYNAEIAAMRRCSRVDVIAFARKIKIAPGVVVGRLQHEGTDHRFLNDLKAPLEWA